MIYEFIHNHISPFIVPYVYPHIKILNYVLWIEFIVYWIVILIVVIKEMKSRKLK